VDGATQQQHECEWRQEALTLRAKVGDLEHQLDVLRRQVFGKKSEKMPRPAELLKKRGDIPKQTPDERKKKRAESCAWKDDLDEVELRQPLPLASEMTVCGLCGTVPSHPMPDQVTYSYEEQPAKMVRRKHVQPQVRCQCGSCIVTASAPTRIYDKCQYGEQLAAHLITAKCADAIAIERFARQLARLGVPVPASTLGSLFHRCAGILQPLYARLVAVIAAQEVVQADETPVQVLAKQKTRRGWIWTFNADELVAYVFSATRSGETPQKVLGGTTGTLVVDGYTGYNQVTKPENRMRSACLSHVRRKLFDAREDAPEMQRGLDLILDVYRVEHKALAQCIVRTPAHAEMRRTESKAAMDALHAWLNDQKDRHLPQSPAGKAIAYALGQWPYLQVFLGRIDVPPDNNKSERLLRVLARGRSSYLFVGHDEAGQNLAMLMSLVATAEACGKNPQAYLADVLLRVQTHPANRIDELLPQNWAPPQPSG
jgi:transposase